MNDPNFASGMEETFLAAAAAVGTGARPTGLIRWRKGDIGSILQSLWEGPGGNVWIDVPRVIVDGAGLASAAPPRKPNPDSAPPTPVQLSMKARIEAMETEGGGFTREALAELGVPWPPPKGWKKKLIREAGEKP